MKKPVILIKLGGSAITDKTTPYKARKNVIRRLAQEFNKRNKKYNYILAHGSGSFGHYSANKFGGKRGYKSKIGIATVSKDANKINQIVTDIFVEEGIPVISLRPMSMIVAKKGKLYDKMFQSIDEVLSQGLIPMVYGDVIWDKDWDSTIFSGEKVLTEISKYLIKKDENIEKIIEVGETNGVYDMDGKTIIEINNKNWKINKQYIEGRQGFDVTGGMHDKVEEALRLARNYNIETLLINHNKNNLIDSMQGKNYNATCIRNV